ncbi:MAG: hypothetical protein MUF11_08605, partial [Beijerinckiaceae bacterium]|nr:hypothetical protein [Beijerinckiaceae bacterium]
PAIDGASEIRLVRNMICHISEYDIERGKFPDQDDRSFDGVFRQSDGRIHIAHRIEILDCVSRFRTVSQTLFAREYWGKGRKPRGT